MGSVIPPVSGSPYGSKEPWSNLGPGKPEGVKDPGEALVEINLATAVDPGKSQRPAAS